ncbi:hypothetical protein DICVIV_04498 [Dictyocaulus viviparus]|uniref:Uncharacterized protein n=1 Tax=Dictyocaulus viviparus TaxID=29172 RepID=A0A0D8XXI0_DICVI|nr:hypothetical protein DICVIV_04498 [Dictyocaulus viviparus]
MITITLSILVITYRHDDFDELTFSMLNTPTSAAPRISGLFTTLGAISVFVIIGMQTLLRLNKRTRRRLPWSLSSRYQILENMYITKFATCLSLLQLTIYVLYSVGGLGMRAAQRLLFGDDHIAFGTARGVFYLIPLFTFLLPFLTIYLHRRYRLERDSSIEANLCLKSTGMEGACNYEDAIRKLWKTANSERLIKKNIWSNT